MFNRLLGLLALAVCVGLMLQYPHLGSFILGLLLCVVIVLCILVCMILWPLIDADYKRPDAED